MSFIFMYMIKVKAEFCFSFLVFLAFTFLWGRKKKSQKKSQTTDILISPNSLNEVKITFS